MKKLFLAMCIALVSLNASAQKGEQNIGAHVLYGTDVKNIGLGAKYQYNVTDAIRLEAVGDYYLKKDGFSMFDINLNGHYLFPVSDKVTLYPLVGINYTSWKQDDVFGLGDNGSDDYYEYESADNPSMSGSSIGLNIGGGVQYKLTNHIRIGAELKYQTITGYNSAIIGIGATFTL
ncbi:MAG: outer membrane beta-barrel protein [Prevotella sp.]|nr:outer membrane beta-barrel protein [Prevotella sp.]